MQEEFKVAGIELVAISPDTVEQAAKMRSKLDLSFRVLGDPELTVIDAFGVRHEKSEGAMAGDPKDARGIRRPLAIPTAVLIDAEGIVRWIDQASDYRVRSDAPRVLEGVKQGLAAA